VTTETFPTSLPPTHRVSVEEVQHALSGARRVVFLDDDPTGTQTVRQLPVLTSWSVDDIRWALREPTAGFFILTNTRSLAPESAAARVREIVTACLSAAEIDDESLVFASRSDSTLRGHFPLETDVISDVIERRGGTVNGVLLIPAYVDAGRVTIDGVHWVQTSDGSVPVAETDFARDATFGFRSSRLRDWVAEKSAGRIHASDVLEIGLTEIRTGDIQALQAQLMAAGEHQVVAPDIVDDDDLRAITLALLAAERAGATFVYRIGPSFVRARVGQRVHPPISDEELANLVDAQTHGLVVVGSHVGLSSRQLSRLSTRRQFVSVELDVPTVLDEHRVEAHLQEVVAAAVDALGGALVVLSTSRTLVTGAEESASLDIARRVSTALTRATGLIVAARRPAYVIAKGGITSSDVATRSLGIERARIRGSLLPGIVSLWEPVAGPSTGLPYIVFAGNVGDDDALADVVDRLEPK
jgi:uncharacterized protein YgbK (DUF1537 family)